MLRLQDQSMSLRQRLRQELVARSEEKYRCFSASLLPGVPRLLGVRLPLLRKMASRLVRDPEWKSWLDLCLFSPPDDEYFEEIMLQGMVIGCAPLKGDAESVWRERAALVRAFVPKIDNWSLCDSFCVGLKGLASDIPALQAFLSPYIVSEREFDLRFAVVMMVDHLQDAAVLPWVLEKLNKVRHSGYYARMAAAWALSLCYVRFPDETWAYLRSSAPDREILAMTLRKIMESRQVGEEERRRIRSFRKELARKKD